MLVVGYAAAVNSVANIAADKAPDLALRFSPNHPVALAAKADAQLRMGREEAAAQLAVASIRATSLSSAGFQVLAMLASAGAAQEESRRLFEHTSRLSRRQTPAQIWLLQQELFEGEPATALVRIDGVMRVSSSGRQALYPILASVITAGPLIAPITDLFANNPVWLPGFLNYAIRNGVGLANLAQIIVDLPEDSVARSPAVQVALLGAMVRAGDYSGAHDFLQETAPSPATELVRDPTFERNGPYAPFDWSITNNVKLDGSPAEGGGLRYEAATGEGGLIARQLVILAPGTYGLITAGRLLTPQADGGGVWRIRCADGGSDLLQLPMTVAPTGERVNVSGRFTVPEKGCSAQWLELRVRATFSPGGLRGTVDFVQIQPAVGG